MNVQREEEQMVAFVPLFYRKGNKLNWSEYSKVIREEYKKRGIPFAATFELTPYCNFDCNMCYIHLSPEEAKIQGNLLTTNQWLHIAREAKECGAIALEITGGEATVRPDFPLLYEAFIRMGYLINLRTNGYLIKGELLDLLRNLKPKGVSITLYGASDETYRKICGIADGFSVVTNNILALRSIGIEPTLTVTMTKDNVGDKEEIKNWAIKNGFNIHFFGGLFTPIRSAKRSIKHLRLDYGINEDRESAIPLREIADREKYSTPFWMCRGFGTKFCVSWDGRMTLCNCFPAIWSDPMSMGVRDAYKSLYKQLSELKRPAECSKCQYVDYCSACPAYLLSDTGDPEKTCDSICSMARENYRQYLNNTLQ